MNCQLRDSPESGDRDGREVPIGIPGEREDRLREEYPRATKDSVVRKRKDGRDFVAGLGVRQVPAEMANVNVWVCSTTRFTVHVALTR